jgi:hypothetical protein
VSLLTGAARAQFPAEITISPTRIAVGSGDTTVTVSGTKFQSSFQIYWNGRARPTQFVSAWSLKARIPASDLAQPGLAQVSVVDPTGGAPASNSAPLMIYLPLQTWDLATDSVRGLIYASLSKRDANGPAIAVIDPAAGIVQRYIPLVSEPGQLALSSNSQYLYVALTDRIHRIYLSGAGSDLDILYSVLVASIPGEPSTISVSSILPLPGDGTSFVIVIGFSNYQAIAVDGSTPRANYSNDAPRCLVGVSGGTLLYGGPGLRVLTLGADGMPYSATTEADALAAGQGCPVTAGGLLYGSDGDIVDPIAAQRVGWFGGWGLVDVALDRNQAYFVGYESSPSTTDSGGVSLMVFDTNTQALIESAPIPVNLQLYAGRLIHWGSDGVAFGDFNSYYSALSDGLYLLHVQALQ